MATARVSFAPPPSSNSGESSPANSVVTLDSVSSSDTAELSELKAILGDTAHLIVARERLTVVGEALVSDGYSEIFLGSLDETPQSPRNVTVKRIRKFKSPASVSSRTLTIAKFIQVWKDLKHSNVLGLLGYTLRHENEIDRLLSPYLIHGNIRDYLNQAPLSVGVDQRLGFVRDVTAGLDYLHRRSPPVCRGNSDLRSILIDQNFNAVLSNFESYNIFPGTFDELRYASPEMLLEGLAIDVVAGDVWAWGCVAFEILTDLRPFNQHEGDPAVLRSLIDREAPGQLDLILRLVPDAPKPECASTLRLLHTYLPLCWEYQPKRRPPISLLCRYAFMLSSEDDRRDSVVNATLEELAHRLIPPDRLQIVERSELGAGNLGEVVLGALDETSSTPRDVAVKRLKGIGTRGEHVRLAKRLARELNIWAKIKHPNVLELIGYCLDDKYESPLLISALMMNGNVLDYIERTQPDLEQRIGFVKGITSGLACLHGFDPAICHGDLKPANVLIDSQMNAVLCDFGLAPFISGSSTSTGLVTSTTIKGTPRYMSPELLLESGRMHSLESDVWAWACTVFQILTDIRPFTQHETDSQVLSSIGCEAPGQLDRILSLVSNASKPEYASTLRVLHTSLRLCWEHPPRRRPSIFLLLWGVLQLSFANSVGDSTETWRRVTSIGHKAIRVVAVKRLKMVVTRRECVRIAKHLKRELDKWARNLNRERLLFMGIYFNLQYRIQPLVPAPMADHNVLHFVECVNPNIRQRIALVSGITAGLTFLHGFDPAICHGDLKPDNVLMDSQMNAVLCDFGLASFIHGLVTVTTLKGTPRYMSPELLLESGRMHNRESDIWAWAFTVFQILTAIRPFTQHETDPQTLSYIDREAPGQLDRILDLVSDSAPKPEYASALRVLHTSLRLWWEYQPRGRPSIFLLLLGVLQFSFGNGAGDSIGATLDELNHLLLSPDRLRIDERSELGAGNYGQVVLGTLDEGLPTQRPVAVKRLKAVGTRGERIRLAKVYKHGWDNPINVALVTFLQRLTKDLRIWAKIKHPNVVELIGLYLDEKYESPVLISALTTNGNVLDYIERFKPGLGSRIGFVEGVTAGLAFLHSFSPPICHADLKPTNVLIDFQMNAVLCDFGLASFISGSGTSPGLVTSTTLKGTPRYMSPELLLESDCMHSLESDVWAWACTVFQILTDIRPFNQHETDLHIFSSILNRETPGLLDKIVSLIPDSKSEHGSTLSWLPSYLPLCWDYEPRKRPSISVLRQQVFVFSFEDDAVLATLEELAHLLIHPDRLRIDERSELGAGNYGQVVLGTLDEASPTARAVAVKRLKAVGTRRERILLAKRLAKELRIWAKIKHPNVVELIGFYLDKKYESPLLISALMTNGNVLDYTKRCEPDLRRKIAFGKGITAGLAWLHSFTPPICHADLKPANVLIDLQLNAVLCDFGLASFVSGSGDLPGLVTTTSLKGTPRYMSPELLLESDCTHNLESDVWAWACTVFEVLTGRIPYAEITGDVQFYLAIGRREIPGDVALLLPDKAENADSESTLHLRFLYSTLPQCWDFDPHNRPSICALLSHLSDTSPQTGAGANRSKDFATGDPQTQQVLSDPSSRRETSFNGNKDVASGGLEEGKRLAETSEDPSGSCAEVERAREDRQGVPTNAHPEAEGTKAENSKPRQDASAIERDADREPRLGENDKAVTEITSYRSLPKISNQPLSTLIWATALILSISANIFLLLRKVDSSPSRDQEATRATYQERDL